jgi:hypothetical protein
MLGIFSGTPCPAYTIRDKKKRNCPQMKLHKFLRLIPEYYGGGF